MSATVTGGRRAPPLRRMVVGSLVAHGVVLLLVWASGSLPGPRRAPPPPPMMARLVRLGKPRPKELLPRLSAAAQAPEPPPPPTPTPPKPAPAAPTPAPTVPLPAPSPAAAPPAGLKVGPKSPLPPPASTARNRARARALSKLHAALDRLHEEEEAGQADGDAAGSAADALAGERYAAEIDACLHANYVIEGYAAERVAGVSAQVVLRVGHTGKIIDYRLTKSSGVAAFDLAVGRAVGRCGNLSPPPPHLLQAIGREGIEVTFRP